MTRDEIITYCHNEYNSEITKPFKHFPNYVAIRHLNGKWFALIMDVPADKLGLPGSDKIDILDLKVDPELNSILQTQPNFLPGYHMSKAHWITAILPRFKTIDELADLIEGSFSATE
ncbi:MmcQ/YjbR family DNA-binding protein [Secundilactobacillus folii]|uniref:MmcQ/YjbR family DNA-binding protein n=1 Tax=Secundilactobacillus folii TaxID=2678357 RepID=A0A7X3C2J7_9LACO|nr:MmcQ/YjbR family DNA-binding protein [Secundilactobacillus folii]MTV81542.1 MmcQ/YjbR family DNA-binding protein [Secundilactobacillus folii]